MDNPPSGVNIVHWVWTGIITVLGFLMSWNWNKLNKDVEKKMDTEEAERRFMDMAAQHKAEAEGQADMHAENRARLDKIYELLVRLNRKGDDS